MHNISIYKRLIVTLSGIIAACIIFPGVANASSFYNDKTVTISAEKAPLKEILYEISNQTGIGFMYRGGSEEIFSTRLSLNVNNMNVKDVLETLFKGTNFTFNINGETITIIYQKKAERKTITGKVKDNNGNSLAGVTVFIRGTSQITITDENGDFKIDTDLESPVIVFSYIGMKTEELLYTGQKEIVITLKETAIDIDQVVVTGIFTRKAESFTGASQTFSNKDIEKLGNQNLFQSLKNLDPSLFILDNFQQGSNPNALPSMQLRGISTFQREEIIANQAGVNMPLFILDGFEARPERIFDLDMNRIAKVTILKDASSKAIYGSKGSNGVIVIETKRSTGEKARVTYTGSLDIEMPDLTSYNLTNSMEKLEVELYEGVYDAALPNDVIPTLELYNKRYKLALEGLDTYWLSKPLQVGIRQKHAVSFELGEKSLRAIANIAYNGAKGVMKGSSRSTFSGDVNLSYVVDKVTFRNIMSFSSNKSADSPYGTFNQYARMNPYWKATDDLGNVLRYVEEIDPDNPIPNPMYDAQLNTKLTQDYINFTNNLYADWNVSNYLKIIARLGLNIKRSGSDTYYPVQHSSFINYSEDDLLRRGSYNKSYGNSSDISGDLNLQYNRVEGVHTLFANLGVSMRENKYDDLFYRTEGFPSDRLENIIFARQYALNSKPSGFSSISREAGALMVAGYTYDNRYLTDLTLRGNASSLFGSEKLWASFWSFGLGWNIHREKFMQGVSKLDELKLRGSVGTSGNQNFVNNGSISYYSYVTEKYYDNQIGVLLNSMANPDLEWEKAMDYNIGLDLKYGNLLVNLDFYRRVTKGLVADIDIVPSTGFETVKDNLGEIENKGMEAKVSYTIFRTRNSFLNINGAIATNNNKIRKISDQMKQFNDRQNSLASDPRYNKPVIRYIDGMPLNAIWAVRSLGIDPSTGDEIYLDRNNNRTYDWNASDMVMSGVSTPKFNGIFGVTGETKGIGFNVVFRFLGGGQMYNQTLVDRVENIDPIYNVDKRVLSGRWKEEGQQALYKRLGGTYLSEDAMQSALGYTQASVSAKTQATTRFVQDRNELTISSLSLYYEFNAKQLRKTGLSRLRVGAFMNDIHTFSSIEIERGTYYPFARTLSLNIIGTF
ncbi:MAG: SusC/RagA family TonB-linked outer membrane protein [Bacteroidales bacterium]|nr:SusC/RagA family TonB-linked outer membrane protein [Bacteroidales bacterium]